MGFLLLEVSVDNVVMMVAIFWERLAAKVKASGKNGIEGR
jgi:hypothetical protein